MEWLLGTLSFLQETNGGLVDIPDDEDTLLVEDSPGFNMRVKGEYGICLDVFVSWHTVSEAARFERVFFELGKPKSPKEVFRWILTSSIEEAFEHYDFFA